MNTAAVTVSAHKGHNSIMSLSGAWLVILIFSLVFVLCPIASPAKGKKNPSAKRADRQAEDREEPAGRDAARETAPDAKNGEAIAAEKPAASEKAGKPEKGPPANDKGTLYDYEKPAVEEESYGWMIFKTIIILGVLVGGFYYFFRFVTKKTGMQLLGRDVIQVLSVVPLAQNKFLQVVDLAGRIIVLGVSDNNINIITEIKDKDEIDRIRLLSSKSTPPQLGGFPEHLARQVIQLGRFFRRPQGDGHSDHGRMDGDHDIDRLDYLRKQRERLKGLNGKDDEK